MTVRVVEEQIEKDVAFLEDVDVRFVSLVRHGANQMPFRLIKSDKKGGDLKSMMVIQSILIPKHLDVAELAKGDLGFLSDAKLESPVDYDEYRTYEQASQDVFQADTLKMVKLHDHGVWAVAGEVKDGENPETAITLGKDATAAAKEIPVSPMDTPLPPSQASAVQSFKELFDRELYSMLDVVVGTLNQSSNDMKKRKSNILNAVDAFRSFLVIGLDAVGSEAAKVATKFLNTKEEDQMTELFKTKEEFVAAVAECINETVPGMITESIKVLSIPAADPQTDPAATKTEDPPVKKEDAPDPAIVAIQEGMTAMQETVADLTKKFDNSLGTDPAATQNEDPQTTKTDETDPDPEKDKKGEKSVFAGLLTSPA